MLDSGEAHPLPQMCLLVEMLVSRELKVAQWQEWGDRVFPGSADTTQAGWSPGEHVGVSVGKARQPVCSVVRTTAGLAPKGEPGTGVAS